MRRVHKLALEKKGWIGEGGEHSGWGKYRTKVKWKPFFDRAQGGKSTCTHRNTHTHNAGKSASFAAFPRRIDSPPPPFSCGACVCPSVRLLCVRLYLSFMVPACYSLKKQLFSLWWVSARSSSSPPLHGDVRAINKITTKFADFATKANSKKPPPPPPA